MQLNTLSLPTLLRLCLFLAIIPLLPGSILAQNGGVTAITDPVSGCGLTSMEHIAVNVTNFGTTILTGVPVSFSLNFAPPVTEVVPVPIGPGQTVNYTFVAPADLSFPGSFNFVDVWTSIPGDTNPGNDSLLAQIIENRPAIPFFPYIESFENGGFIPLNWSQDVTDGPQNWSFTSGGTPSTGTGPSGDHTSGNGFYAYVEDSNNDNNNVSLITPCFDFSTLSNPQMTFWIHSNEVNAGATPANLNELYVDVFLNGIWINNVAGPISHLGNSWVQQIVDLSAYAGMVIGIRFRVNNNNGTFSHDIAIDDVVVKEVYNNDLSVIKLLEPTGGICGDSNTVVSAVILNEGALPQTGFSVVSNISGSYNGTLSTVYSGTIMPNQFDTVLIGTFNSVLGGPFAFKTYNSIAGDGNPSNDTLLTSNVQLQAIPMIPAGLDQLRCTPGSFSFTIPPAPNQTVNWYNSPTAVNPIFVGNTLTTPSISNPTTIYVEIDSEIKEHVGPQNNTFGSGGNFLQVNNVDRGQVFDAFQDLVLDSLLVYPQNAGNVVVNLLGNGGTTVLNSTSVAVPPTGSSGIRIPVGFTIPAGTGYELNAVGTTTGGLYRNNAGAAYPYTSPSGALSITDNIASSNGFYYYFYDWAIRIEGCKSGRVPVHAGFYPNPPAIDLGPDMAVCPGTVLSAFDTAFVSYLWSNGNTNAFIVPLTGGPFSVTATDSNGCTSSDNVNIFNIFPKPTVSLGPDTANCGPYVLNAANPGGTYVWSTGDSLQTLLVDTSGTYSVVVTNPFGCKDTNSVNVQVLEVPIVKLGPDFSVCEGTTLIPDTTSGTSCTWNTGSIAPSIEVDSSGLYWLTCNLANGCEASDSVYVTVNPNPVVDLGPDSTWCDLATLDAGNPGSVFLWSTLAGSQVVNLVNSGTYSVMVTTPEGCTGEDTVNIVVDQSPVALFSAVPSNDSIATFNSSMGSGPLSYLWVLEPGNDSSTLEEPVFFPDSSGIYTLTLISSNSCGSDTLSVMLNVTITSVQDDFLTDQLKVFPNPAVDFLTIRIPASAIHGALALELFDTKGARVYASTQPYQALDLEARIDVREYPTGIYLLRISSEKGFATRRIQIQ